MGEFRERDARVAALFRAAFGVALAVAVGRAAGWLLLPALPALIAFAVGYRPRVTGALVFGIAWALAGGVHGAGSLASALAFWAWFADLGARWSLDRLLGRRIGRANIPGLPIALLQIQAALALVDGDFSAPLFCAALLFVPGRALDALLAALARALPPIDVYYDGQCGFCRRSVRVIRALDVCNRVRALDAHDAEARALHPNVDFARTERELVTVAGANVRGGFDGVRALAWRLPILWIAVPFGYIPPVPQIGRIVYGYIAARRARAACPIERAHELQDEPIVRGPAQLAVAALLIAQMLLVLFAFFAPASLPRPLARELAAVGLSRPR